MKIAVLGAGAIGAYVGAALDRGGADVSLIARGAHLEALKRDGVRVLSARGDFEAHPPATSDPSEIGPVDVVFLGLKAYSYAASAPLLKPLMHEHTAVVAAQNGIPWWYFHELGGPFEGHRIEAVDPGGATSRTIEPRRAIGCVVYCAAEVEAPGVIRHVEGTRFSIGEPDGTVSERCTAFSQAMAAGGLKCPIETDIRNDIWVKLLGNVVFNPLSALTRATMSDITGYPPTRELVRTIMIEAREVARAVGCEPAVEIERRLQGAERVGAHKTSTLLDLEAGKTLELGAIVTAVIELADLTGVAVPSLRAIAVSTELLARTLGLSEA